MQPYSATVVHQLIRWCTTGLLRRLASGPLLVQSGHVVRQVRRHGDTRHGAYKLEQSYMGVNSAPARPKGINRNCAFENSFQRLHSKAFYFRSSFVGMTVRQVVVLYISGSPLQDSRPAVIGYLCRESSNATSSVALQRDRIASSANQTVRDRLAAQRCSWICVSLKRAPVVGTSQGAATPDAERTSFSKVT